MNKVIKKILIYLFIIIIFFYIAGIIYKWYESIYWLDMAMHIAGGLWSGLFILYILSFNSSFNNLLPIFKILFCLGFVALIGIFWEYYEFFMDIIILKKYPYNFEPGYIYFDTLKDLWNDLVGAILSLIIYFKRSA